MKFIANVQYGPVMVRVETDSFEEFHQAVARLQELSQDYAFLLEKTGRDEAILRFYVDKDGNEYYGFQDPATRANTAFGKHREKQLIGFFPKGIDGYYPGGTAEKRENNQPLDRGQSRRDSSLEEDARYFMGS